MKRPLKLTKHLRDNNIPDLIIWLGFVVMDYPQYMGKPIDQISQRDLESVQHLNEVTVLYANRILNHIKGATK